MTPGIAVRGVTVRYGDTVAIEDVDLEVGRGRLCGVLGVNGSGKSTLFKTLVELIRPVHGEIRLLGGSARQARRAALVSYVPQSEAIDWNFPISVREVVMLGRYARLGFTRRPRAVDRSAVADALARVDLTARAATPIAELSGGQRKRVLLARALAQRAELLLLDEPFAGVDGRSEATIVELLHQLRDAGQTILLSTHDLASVPELCDEAVLLHRRVVARGSPADVLATATHARVLDDERPTKRREGG